MFAQVDVNYVRTRPLKLFSRLVSYFMFEGRPLTTRGQWINSLVLSHFSIEKMLPQIKEVKEPIFILGTGRSGTTILGIVLSMHKEVGFLNEPKALWYSVYPHEDLIGSYSRGKASYRLEASDASDETKKSAKRLYGAYLASTFSKRVVDKYPELIFRVPFVQALFPNAKFLFLVRNGWDTCFSIENWSERLGKQKSGEVHDWWGVNHRKWNLLLDQIVPEHADLAPHVDMMRNWTNQTCMAAVEWIVAMREGLRLLEQYPDSVLRVNYEELCIKPRLELLKMTNFFGLKDDELFLCYGETTLKPIVEKSSFKLDPTIESVFIETMRELGYEG